jgi:hypothetical protein
MLLRASHPAMNGWAIIEDVTRRKFPRLQLRTVKALMEGKGLEHPTSAAALDDTFKKAPASRKKHGHQPELEM